MADSYKTGGWLLGGGILISVVGLGLTATGIGAICGLPLILFIGLPLKIIGIAQMQKNRKVQFKQPYNQLPIQQIYIGTPQNNGFILCRKCGNKNNSVSNFCYVCGENLIILQNPKI